jgi:hypothetical protein
MTIMLISRTYSYSMRLKLSLLVVSCTAQKLELGTAIQRNAIPKRTYAVYVSQAD